ncbi:hypothetical protein NUM3379_23770 [Kineococcus sp. NUM-3379]
MGDVVRGLLRFGWLLLVTTVRVALLLLRVSVQLAAGLAAVLTGQDPPARRPRSRTRRHLARGYRAGRRLGR